MEIDLAPEVRELLSDEQIAAVEADVRSTDTPCIHCGEPIDQELSDAAVVMLVDADRRRAAVRVAHAHCGDSAVLAADLPEPPDARLAERWAGFVLPRVPLLVLQARADLWADEQRPALLGMLESLGFEAARELLDSDLFATGVGEPPRARGLSARPSADGMDLDLVLTDGTVIETLPGAFREGLGDLIRERGGVALVLGTGLGLPEPDTGPGVAFDALLPALLDRAIGAFVPLADPIRPAAT